MKIRPKNILSFQNGGVPQWYLDRYGNRTSLLGWNSNLKYNYSNKNLNANDHRNAGNLDTVYRKNIAYTGTPGAISSDILSFYNSDGQGMSAEDFVNFYNKNAQTIRDHWATNQTYNARTAGDHNKLFKRMFVSRSNLSMSPGSDYNIGYQNDLEDIEGSSTWLRRMDLYENEFDPNKPDPNRLHEITLSNGLKAIVYKKANGDIGLYNPSNQETPIDGGQSSETIVTPEKKKTQIPVDGNKTYGFDWNKLKEAGRKIFGNPDLYATGRLVGNLINNDRVYDELLKGIKPTLRQTYNTYRQVLGDEATKQAYYRRAVLGETKAARPFTSDADRQMAYQFEAKRVGDELRSQGDLADNQEIRRTSDESNQHLWANIQRATEVANANTASIDQANALRHNLLAQKHSAQWSSIDNFLQGLEYRKRQLLEELKALDDKIYALTRANEIENDSELLDLLAQLEAASKKPENQKESYGLKVINYDSKEIKDIVNKINQRKTQLQIETYLNLYNRRRNNNLGFFKSGSKITHKKKDDLLYKSTKDVVEHFRKMSKISSDALNRKLPKIEKLTSHPKGKTKKYQLGGVAPFTIYKPVALGGETSTTTSSLDTSSNTNKSSSGKETLDLVKSLFKELLGKALPVDVNIIYSQMNDLFTKQKLFGTELDTSDLALMYLQSMLSLSNAMYSKEKHDKAEALATLNEALDEFAVNALGHFIVLDTNTGKLSTEKSWKDVLASGKNPITNSLLLLMREYNPDLAFYKGDNIIGNVISSGMGINKIAAQIKTLAGDIGSYEGKIEGLTQVESNKVKQGLQLLANAPDGYYKHTVEDKNQLTQMKAAIAYITNMLSPSQRAILDAHGGADKLIPTFLASQENITHNVSFLPLTGKASDKGLGSGEKGDVSSNPLLAMLREIGGMYLNYSLVTKDSNTKLSVDGTFYSLLPKISEDMSIDKMLSVSGIGGIIQGKRGITFGNLEIKPEDLKHIMYSNNGGMVVTLPCKIVNGIKLVNLDVVETYEKAERKALQVNSDRNSPQFIQALALELKNEHLDSLLNSNGLPNKNMFGQFLVVEAYTSDKVKFDINSKYVEKVENPDEELELRMSKALSTDNKKSDYALDIKDHWTMFEGTWDDIYKGTVFIPLNNNPNAALNTWGNSAKIGQTTELEELYLISNKSSKFNGNNTLEQ